MILTVFLLMLSVQPGVEPLTKACRAGDLKTASDLIESGVNPNLPDRYGHTPLYYAASFNEEKIVDLLLANRADPNAQHIDPDLRSTKEHDLWEAPATPLQYAVSLGNSRVAERLIAAGADVNATTSGGRTAIHFAANHLDVLQYLIEKGADVNVRDLEGESALDEAVWFGALDAVAILLANGASVNAVESKTGATPINEAAYRGQTRLVEYLLRFHPDLETADNRGNRPLENAIRMGQEKCALLLLDAEPKKGLTPQALGKMMDAAIRKDEPLVVENLLVQRGMSADGDLLNGATPLDAAALAGAAKVIGVLLTNKADPNRFGPNGSSPLPDAAIKGFDAIVLQLLQHGALVNQVSAGSGTTALYAAAAFGKTGTVNLLLEHGANPSLCGKNRKTPYQAAIENGYRDVAAEILEHSGAKGCLP